jgi:hypothetical protein
MKRWERWTFNVLALAVAVSGFAYFWMKYLVQPSDAFAVVNHPWEPAMLQLHVLASPAFVLIFGVILNSHIMKKLRATKIPNRASGLASFATFAAMIGSGYLLQVVSSEGALRGLVAVHVASGVVFTVAYAAHLVISYRLVRATRISPVREVA